MFSLWSSSKYVPLSSTDHPPNECVHEKSEEGQETVARVATSFTFLCVLINVCLISWSVYLLNATRATYTLSPTSKLRLQDSYINLHAVYRHKRPKPSQYGPIINHSRYFTQVSSVEPTRVLPVNETMLLHDNGMIPYYTRRLLVTSTISTLVQFRVMDFGMESCSLVINAPAKNETQAIIKGPGVGASVSVWKYSSAGLLEHDKLSWSTRPRNREFFFSFNIQHGSSAESPLFSCPSLSYQTFELDCGGLECHVDIEGTGEEENGLFMKQYQSL